MSKRYVDIIIFDLDGTLVDSSEDIIAAVNHTLLALGREEKSGEEIRTYIGTGVRDQMVQSLGTEDVELTDKAVKVFTGYFSEHFADKSVLYPHVREVLEHYRDKSLRILTNRRTELTKGTLEKFDIKDYFETVTGGDDGDCLKPSACPVKRLLDGSGIEGKPALMVGDMDLDIKAGKEAGIMTCGVTYGIGSRSDIEEAGPDLLIDDILKLTELIR